MAVTVHRRYRGIPSYTVFLQYATGLAVIEGIKSIPGYANVPLYLKWPNDVYFCPQLASSSGTTRVSSPGWSPFSACSLTLLRRPVPVFSAPLTRSLMYALSHIVFNKDCVL